MTSFCNFGRVLDEIAEIGHSKTIYVRIDFASEETYFVSEAKPMSNKIVIRQQYVSINFVSEEKG